MELRVARHSNNLDQLIRFYSDLLGLKLLGSFKDHDGYNGIFLGKEGLSWHLEFTSSSSPAKHDSDEDDLLVFYCQSEEEYASINARFKKEGISTIKSKNPYWNNHGSYYLDPDGFGIIIAKKRP